jgi:hypothetical protein
MSQSEHDRLWWLVDQQDITRDVFAEAWRFSDFRQRKTTLYIWNITKDSYNYVLWDAEDTPPDVVTGPSISKDFWYKENP